MMLYFQFAKTGKDVPFIIFLLAFCSQSFAQNCQVPINPAVTQFTTGITEIGQSVTMTNCSNGDFSAITIYSNSPHTNARLKIFKDKGMGGDLLYTQTGITINLNLIDGTTIGLTSPVPFISGHSYTFILDFTDGGTWQLHKSTINFYSEGTLYENGNQVADEDLRFVVETSASLLPVELTRFTAVAEQGSSLLTWETASENNNKGFEVERSADGRAWSIIGFVNGQGSTNELHTYEFRDRSPISGKNYYRLRQIDLDGQSEYSHVVSVLIEGGLSDTFSFFPNPVAAGQPLTLTDLGENAIAIQLLDARAKPVFQQNFPANNNSHRITLPANLPTGMYWLAVVTPYNKTTKMVMVR